MTIEYKGHKIFAFADTHGMYRRLQVPADTDILICAGDACEGFNPAELEDFFAWYNDIPAKLRIFIAGNHDMVFDKQPEYARRLIPDGINFLGNCGIEFDGIKFHSVPSNASAYTRKSLTHIDSKNSPIVLRSFTRSLGPTPKAATPMDGSEK